MSRTPTPTQDDLNAAARGLRMVALPAWELRELIERHTHNTSFASQVIAAAARQMFAAKARVFPDFTH